MIPSPYQQAIYDWIEHGTGNAVVDAVAGAGKMSTLLEGAKRLHTRNACFLAFNKVIAEEIASRLQDIDSPMQASTIHSLGKRCLGKARIEDKKYTKLSRKYIQGLPERELVLKETPEATAVKQLRGLVNFAQLTMTEPTEVNLRGLVEHYALDDLLALMARNSLLWEVIWQGVSIVIEAGIDQYQRERIIDFNDMVCLPTVLGLSTPHFDFLLVDEAQDLNRAQLELVLVCMHPQGRLLFCGDKRQCQPAGTLVRLSNGNELPIEELLPGMSVVTFDRRAEYFVKRGAVTASATRYYDGTLYTLQAGGMRSKCTDSHKWLVRWINTDREAWVTSLMRQGTRYRFGQACLFLKGAAHGDFGLASRARQERANAAWILTIHHSLAESLVYEQIISAKYGLPEAVFTQSYGIRCVTQEMIDHLFEA